jgi:hypothetical protein
METLDCLQVTMTLYSSLVELIFLCDLKEHYTHLVLVSGYHVNSLIYTF